MYSVQSPHLLRRLLKDVIWKIPTEKKEIFLTFDDGPIPVITPWVLQVLKEYEAKATFFCLGANVEKYREVYKMILAGNHGIGNHTYSHKNGWRTRRDAYLDDVRRCSEIFPAALFRPPYGKLRKSHYLHLKREYKIVMWTVLSGDFDRRTSNAKCLSNVINHASEGSVIVFHDSEKALKKLYHTLPGVLEHFSRLGYSFQAIPGSVR